MPDPRSTSHGGEGPRFNDYGRLFTNLRPLAVPDSVFLSLGAADGPMVDPESNVQPWNSQSPPDDGENNTTIPAGYTYLGQFIDHDLTLDFTSDPNRSNRVEELSNARTPAFDLDSVYGLGPEVHPHLYAANNSLSRASSGVCGLS